MFGIDLSGDLLDLDVQRRYPLTDVVVQLSCNPLPLDFLAGNQPPRQVAIELRGSLQLRDVAHNTEKAVTVHSHDACLEALPIADRQFVLDDHWFVALVGLLQGIRHQFAERRWQHITYLAAHEYAWRDEQQFGIAGVVVDERTVAPEDKHQVRECFENGDIARFGACRGQIGRLLFLRLPCASRGLIIEPGFSSQWRHGRSEITHATPMSDIFGVAQRPMLSACARPQPGHAILEAG